MEIKIKPIKKWIGTETKYPGSSRFKQTYSNTKKLLRFELEKLNVVDSGIQLEMFIEPEDLRLDGELRASAKPYKPGVVLSFSIISRRLKNNQTGKIRNETKTLSYPCDTYNDWQDNLRAIALSLAKLRDVARYGVFKYEDMISRLALPSAEGKLSDSESALKFIADHSPYEFSLISTDSAALRSAYKAALHALHPDKNNGAQEEFLKLQEAKRILNF